MGCRRLLMVRHSQPRPIPALALPLKGRGLLAALQTCVVIHTLKGKESTHKRISFFLQQRQQIMPSHAVLIRSHIFWRAAGDDFAAACAAFWTHVDDPVCGFDHV